MNLKLLLPLVGLSMLAGCRGEFIFAGNVAIAAVPCLLLYLTLNLQKER